MYQAVTVRTLEGMSRPRPALALSVVAAMVCGALGAAVYVTFTFGGNSDPAPVNVRQAAATSAPTVTVTANPAAVKPVKKATRKAATTTRSLVTTQQKAAAAEPTDTASVNPPGNGAGGGNPNPQSGPPTINPIPMPTPTP